MKYRYNEFSGMKVMLSFLILLHHYLRNVWFINGQPSNRLIFFIANYCGVVGVEIFFYISGFLCAMCYAGKLKDYSITQYIKRRFSRLFLIAEFSVLSDFLCCYLNNILTNNEAFENTPQDIYHFLLSAFWINNGWFENSFGAYGSGMWFMCELLLCNIIFYMIDRINDSNIKKICYAIMIAIGIICVKCNWEIPFLYFTSGRGYLTFFSGALLYNIVKDLDDNQKKISGIISLFVNIIFWFSMLFWGMERSLGDVSVTGRFYMIYSILICPAIMLVCMYIEPIKRLLSLDIFIRLEKITMPLYLTHGIVLKVMFIIVYLMGSISDWSVKVSSFITTVIVCYSVAYIIMKMNNFVLNSNK